MDSGSGADAAPSDAGVADAAPPPARDASVPLPACPPGQVCLDQRCYPVCRTDADCAASEQCAADGACVPRTRPRVDAGPTDSGPTDPCETVPCSGATPVCNPLLVPAACQPCGVRDRSACGAATPICEVARGQCSAFDTVTRAATCGPCNIDADCAGGATCLTPESPAALERVCVPSCGDAGVCPQGLACDDTMGVCLPPVGSCFEYRGAADGRACDTTEKCAPIGASTDHVECRGDLAGGVGLCETVCTASTECPPGIDCFMGFCHKPTPCSATGTCAIGLVCGGDGFCHPLTRM